jgi:HK97 family phage major capsid protein
MSEQKIQELLEKLNAKVADIETQKAANLAVGTAGRSMNSLEQKTLQAFGVSHVKDLLGVNTGHVAFAAVPAELKQSVLNLKKSVDVARMVAGRFHGSGLGGSDETVNKCRAITDSYYAKHVLVPQLKAFGSTVVGGGDEWVPTLMAQTYIEEIETPYDVHAQFKEIPMQSNPYEMPVKTGATTARLIAEGATATAANFATSKIQFNAKKFVEFMELPEELNEDSAAPIYEIIRDEIVKAQLRALETSIINGDDSLTHQDSDVTAASDARKAYKGLRKLAIANSANGSVVTFGSAVTAAKLDEMMQAGGKFTLNPRDAMFIMSPSLYHQARSLDIVSTVDKFGPHATILGNALAAYRGIPVIASEYLREDLNVAGVYDGITVNNSGLLLVNKNRFMIGRRRPITLRIMQNLPNVDSWMLASYQRAAFAGVAQSAAEVSVIYGVDVTV